jgi:hypothetical protein
MTNFLILFIVAPVLYMILGTVFGILLTLLQTDNLKLKIVLLTILRPITYTFILSLLLPALFDDSWIWLSGFALAVVLRDVIFSNLKFLQNVTINKNNISIQYINTFLRTKTIDFTYDNTILVQLSGMKSISDYPAKFKIGDSDDPNKFIIITKNIWNLADANLDAANMRFAAMPADGTQHQF